MAKKKSSGNPGKTTKLRKQDLMRSIMAIFNRVQTKPLNYKQISHALDIKRDAQKQLVVAALDELEAVGEIVQVQNGKYRLNLRMNSVTGILDRQTVAKKTYLIPDDGGEPVFIAERSMGCALNGVRVNVLLYPRRKGREQDGEVADVI